MRDSITYFDVAKDIVASFTVEDLRQLRAEYTSLHNLPLRHRIVDLVLLQCAIAYKTVRAYFS